MMSIWNFFSSWNRFITNWAGRQRFVVTNSTFCSYLLCLAHLHVVWLERRRKQLCISKVLENDIQVPICIKSLQSLFISKVQRNVQQFLNLNKMILTFFPNQTLVQVIQRQLCILLADYKSFTTNLQTPPLDYTIQMGILATLISLH